jgi:hypothetical protein
MVIISCQARKIIHNFSTINIANSTSFVSRWVSQELLTHEFCVTVGVTGTAYSSCESLSLVFCWGSCCSSFFVFCFVFFVLFVFVMCFVPNVARVSGLFLMLPVSLDCSYLIAPNVY